MTRELTKEQIETIKANATMRLPGFDDTQWHTELNPHYIIALCDLALAALQKPEAKP